MDTPIFLQIILLNQHNRLISGRTRKEAFAPKKMKTSEIVGRNFLYDEISAIVLFPNRRFQTM